MGVTKSPAGSPAAGDEELDDVVDQTAVAEPDPSTGTDVATAPSAETSAAVGDRDTKKQPTALDALKAQLVKAETATDAPPADVVDDAPETATAETDGAEAAKPAATPAPVSDEDDPLHGFTDREKQHPSNKGLVTRIRDLAAERKKLKQAVQEIEPVKQAGEFLTKFQADNDLTPEESVAALALSAAFKRGDPKALEALEAATHQLRADLGLPDPVAPTPEAVEPFRGALPQEYADMIAVLGIPEADVRLMHALIVKHKTAPTKAAAPVQQPAARPAPRPIAQQPTVDRARLDRIAIAANETVLDYLETQKVPKDKAADHVQKNLWPYLAPLSPGNNPSRIPPEERLRLTTLAQQKYVLAQAKARLADRTKNPQPLASTTSSTTPTSSTSKPATELDKLKARMVAAR